MSKDSIIEQLANFDFSSPVEVNVIFEDEEDQVSTPDIVIKKEKTYEEDNITNHNSNNITRPTNSQHDENLIKIKKVFTPTSTVYEVSSKNCSKHIEEYSNTIYDNPVTKRKHDEKIVIEVGTSSQISTNSITKDPATITASDPLAKNGKINDSNSHKRKINEDINFVSRKFSKKLEINKTPKHYEFQGEQNFPVHPNTLETQDYAPSVGQAENTEQGSNTEMTCITNLLQSVSMHLILIMEAYSRFSSIKESKPSNGPETEQSWAGFLRVKYHFFNLSFCTVDSIILPQEKNLFFTGKFLKDTIKLAASKKRTLCLETQVAPLFLELLEWTKQKKLRINNLPSENVSISGPTQNSILHQHLRSPPKHINDISTRQKISPDNWNSSVNSPQQIIRAKLVHVPSENASTLKKMDSFVNNYYQAVPNCQTSAISNSAENEGHALLEDINRYHQQANLPPQYRRLSSQDKNVESNFNRSVQSHVEHDTTLMTTLQINPSMFNKYASSLPKTTQIQVKNNESIQESNINPHVTISQVSSNKTENSKSVLFTKGPPGRKLSITVEQALLQSFGNTSTSNTTAPNRKQRKMQLLKDKHSERNSYAPPNYEQTIQAGLNNQIYTQQGLHTTQQNFVNNYYLQNNVPQGYQNTTAIAVDQTKQNYSQGNNIYMQQAQQTPRQNITSNHFRQNNAPQSYQTTAAAMPFWQQGTFSYNGSTDAKQITPVQPLILPEHQNPEMTRSGSTDSGFMSPLNFYSSSETNKDYTEDNFSLPSPMITYVTSLNPEVKYISEGPCFVCGKMTRKMCNGCYKKYYCSLSCQRFDWSIHKSACGK